MAATDTVQEAIQLDRGPAVLISSWVLITLSAVFVIARGAARKKLMTLESGDILLPLALILAFAQTICIQISVDNGLGRTLGIFGDEAMNKYYQAMYWAQLFYILILGITKTTIALLIIPFRPPKPLLFACYIVVAEVVSSTIAFVFATAFQCHLPGPWVVYDRSHQCINISALNRALSITTVVTDIFVISLPVVAMVLLNLNYDTRVFICSLLATRLLVPIFVVVQFAYLLKYDTSENPTYDIARVQIWTQVVLNLSIVTACVPPLGCILSDIAMGLIGRRMIPDTVGWGRYSPHGISRFHIPYEDTYSQPLRSPDKIPLCSGGLNVEDEQHFVVNPDLDQDQGHGHGHDQEKSNFAWVKLNSPAKVTVFPEVQRPGSNVKQVRFENVPPPVSDMPPSIHYPETELRSSPFENPTMPPPAIPPTKTTSLPRRLSTAFTHKRTASGASSASSTKISEPSFVSASTLVTPPASAPVHRESFQFHRPTRSAGSIRPPSSIYSNRDSFVRSHRLSKSMSSFSFRRSRGSTIWPGWFERWENKIDEERSQMGSGSFVNLDEEFDRCRNRHGQFQR